MNTDEMAKLLDSAEQVLNKLGQKDRAKRLDQIDRRTKDDVCRIAVVGQFKAGKSTLINKVFLKEDLLFTDVLEATAVPTEITYAARKRMEIRAYKMVEETVEVTDGDKSTKKTIQTASLDELPPRVIDAPKAEDVKAATSHETDEGRMALAKSTASVRLQWPAANLKGLIVTDTPGINSLNCAVVTTTYRVIPEADLAIFVTGTSMLNEVELRFLKSHVFDKDVNRCMVVVNHDPFYNPNANIPAIVRTIRAQLAGIGRPHIPVEAVDLRDNKRTLSQSFRAALDTLKAKALSLPPSDDYSVTSLEKKMVAFIQTNALSAKMEKACAAIRHELEGAKEECTVELAAIGKTEDEIATLKRRIESEERKFRNEYNRLGESFLDDLKDVQNSHYRRITSGIDRLCNSTVSKIEECKDVSALHAVIDGAVNALQPDAEAVMHDAAKETKQQLVALSEKYQTALQGISDPWLRVAADGLAINPGPLARAPRWLVLIIDICISNWVLPGGLITALILRWLGSKIPILKLLVPETLFTKAIGSWTVNRMRKEFEGLKAEIKNRMDASNTEVEERVRKGWLDHAEEQIESIRAPLEAADKRRGDPKRTSLLEEAIKALTGLVKALEA